MYIKNIILVKINHCLLCVGVLIYIINPRKVEGYYYHLCVHVLLYFLRTLDLLNPYTNLNQHITNM